MVLFKALKPWSSFRSPEVLEKLDKMQMGSVAVLGPGQAAWSDLVKGWGFCEGLCRNNGLGCLIVLGIWDRIRII